jgi:hypothetical protein
VKIRCERYSDHTIVTMSTTGKVTGSSSGAAVKRGTITHQGRWMHRYAPKVLCTLENFIGAPAVECQDGARHSFAIGVGLLQIKN